ncbi:hypothetical protein RHSP_26704 [Rhizobium freirei PRF 81]|uniref:Uncharacterized protein n=1 Tax=Rhizobium freirei PRF 81 TaxID=363754 RepID=N6V2N9_9HYPH|nr:hypothetical protein RHSP_26704 [Rhizobium freirei PRF 81]
MSRSDRGGAYSPLIQSPMVALPAHQLLHQPRILRRQRSDSRPVQLLAAMRKQGQEPITQQARKRQRHIKRLASSQCQPNVLLSQRRRKTGRLELAVCDQPAIGLIDGRVEQRRGQEIEIGVPVDTALLDERHGLAERLDDGGDEEIAAELDEIGGLWFFAEYEGTLTDSLEERRDRLDGIRRTCCGNEELCRGSGFRTTEDGCRHEALACRGVLFGEPLGHRHADRACGDMNRALAEAVENPAIAMDDGRERVVMGEHGKDGLATARFRHRRRNLGALAGQSLGLVARAIVDRHLMPGLDEIGCHGAAHLAQPDKSDFHGISPSQSACLGCPRAFGFKKKPAVFRQRVSDV